MNTTEIQGSNQTQGNLPTDTSKGYYFLGARNERIVFLAILVLLIAGPIIFSEKIPTHADWHIHMERAYNFKRCFWQGQWLPRWIDAQLGGYGLPIYNYYAPLIYYLFTFIDLFFRDATISFKWAAYIIPMILTVAIGYLYLRRHTSPVSATIASAFIALSPPIHIYVYNCNWPGSVSALVFIFLTLYGIDSFDKTKDFDLKSFLITSTGYAGLAITHIASAFSFTLLSIPYFFLSLNIYRTKRFFKNFFLSFALGGLLAGFYLFPASFESKFVLGDVVLTRGPLWDYSKNFLYTYLDRDGEEGYAWAMFDHRYYETSNAVFCLAVLICIVILLINREKVKSYFKESFRVNTAVTMFVISFLMMTPVSFLVWSIIKPLQTIQFPWRFTTFTAVFGVLILAYTFDLVGKLAKEKVDIYSYRILFYLISCLLCILAYLDLMNMYHWPWYARQHLLKASVNILWQNHEYLPNITSNPNLEQIDFWRDFSPSILSSNPVSDITLIKWKSHERVFQVFSEEEHQLRIKTFYFPGWTAYIDGKQTETGIDPKVGTIFIQVPPGQHEITIRFELTPVRKISSYLSLAALILYLYLLSKLFTKKKTKEKTEINITPKEKETNLLDEVPIA